LSEDSPVRLLQKFGLPSLEDVFLHLCHRDETERGGEDLRSGDQKQVRTLSKGNLHETSKFDRMIWGAAMAQR
jgi:hypothetical protein